jgi:ATP-binding cassette subfamily C (CFTR/MRP) protein 4
MLNKGRSPIFVHTNSTIEGLSTVRSSQKQDILAKELDDLSNNHTRAYFGFVIMHRWFGSRLDFMCAVFTSVTVFASMFLRDTLGLKSGEVGLLMVYLFQLFATFQWAVITMTFIDNNVSFTKYLNHKHFIYQSWCLKKKMTSIERIMEYINIPSEPLHIGRKQVDENWPQKGEIRFNNVSLSYDKNLPDVLRGISVNIKPGEKVGIVGRTGAGKSSFFQILFRMYEPKGEILIDGVDIQSLKLTDLRTKLTIIPVLMFFH